MFELTNNLNSFNQNRCSYASKEKKNSTHVIKSNVILGKCPHTINPKKTHTHKHRKIERKPNVKLSETQPSIATAK